MAAALKAYGGLDRGGEGRSLWAILRTGPSPPGSLPGVVCQVSSPLHFLQGSWDRHFELSTQRLFETNLSLSSSITGVEKLK